MGKEHAARNANKHRDLFADDSLLHRGCFGKIRLSRAEAKSFARKLRSGRAVSRRGVRIRFKPGDDLMSAYRCRCCKSWHIGHDRRRINRANRTHQRKETA